MTTGTCCVRPSGALVAHAGVSSGEESSKIRLIAVRHASETSARVFVRTPCLRQISLCGAAVRRPALGLWQLATVCREVGARVWGLRAPMWWRVDSDAAKWYANSG